ncbi:MAG: hypothetical protein HY730_05260 [Candidatus Tectomicrobia bacterium]|uniref:HTH merR-type domain-containing protein n=1 Tax=Tectimicrobiota bacterium TaxID=2528274 RepID=A0A933LQX7_UNCTE|nr:hypothetical protein [Candidatus Tectomicrobia bacterium]
MNLQEIKEILEATVIVGQEPFISLEIKGACGAELMSDVLAFVKGEAVLLTGLTNTQVIRTAEIADIKAVVFVRAKKPDSETVLLAQKMDIPLLSTSMTLYEACGRLYLAGLPGF